MNSVEQVPGYRIGWLALHDKNDIFQKADVRGGVRSVAQVNENMKMVFLIFKKLGFNWC